MCAMLKSTCTPTFWIYFTPVLNMQTAVMLLSFVAITTGSSLDKEPTTTETQTPQKWDVELPETCPLHNPQEGAPVMFLSPDPMPVMTVGFLLYTMINCSAINFCNITWTWQTEPVVIGDYLELFQDNQILEIQRAFYSRKGNYTCLATDGKESISRTVQLFVIATAWEKPPQPLPGDSCVHQTASVGTWAEFFCFFFVGDTVQTVELTWYKKTELSTWVRVEELNSKETQYEEKLDYSVLRKYTGIMPQPTAGKHLVIKHVTTDAFVDYRLEAKSPYGTEYTQPLSLSAPPIPPKADLTPIIAASAVGVCLLILLLSLAVAWHFVKLDVKIWKKNRFGDLEDNDGKTYDVFISYADEDREFALTILDRLAQAGYSVCFPDRDFLPATNLVEEIILALNTSRRFLIVISPDFISARHSALQVDVATDQLMHKQIKIVPIIYRDVPSVAREEIPLLKRILSNVKTIKWDENHSEKFTKQLVVHMPPRRLVVPQPTGEIEERNLLRGSVTSEAPPFDGAAIVAEAVPELQMNRFLKDVTDAKMKNPCTAEVHNALPC